MKRDVPDLLLLIFLLIMPITDCFEFCDYDITIGFPIDMKPGKASCHDDMEIMVQQEIYPINISKDLFEIEVSDDKDYVGYERDSMIIAIKGAQADPETSSIRDNYKIGNYMGYYGMGTYPSSPKKVYVVQFKLPPEFNPNEGKLVTVKSYLNESKSNELFRTFFILPKVFQ